MLFRSHCIMQTALVFVLLLFASTSNAGPPWVPGSVVISVVMPTNGEPIIIPVKLQKFDTPCMFLVDTGASTTVVDRGLLVGFRPVGESNLATLGSNRPMPLYDVGELKVGSTSCDWVRTVFGLDLSHISRIAGIKIDGVLGVDALSRFIIHGDWDNGQFLIAESNGIDQPPGEVIDLIPRQDSLPYIRCSVGKLEPADFLIDTGALFSGIFESALFDRAHLGGGSVLLGSTATHYNAHGEPTTTRQLRCGAFTLGTHNIRDLVFEPGAENHVGLYYLSRFRFSIDFVKRKAYFLPGKRFARRDQGDDCGLEFGKIPDGSIFVIKVAKNSIADLQGIQIGDRLLEVNGVVPSRIPKPEWDRLWGYGVGSQISLLVGRAKNQLRLSIPCD